MGVYTLSAEQFLPIDIDKAWKFIADPHNLKLITPDYMQFNVLTKNLPDNVYPGMIIQYKVRPLFNIPLHWVTEITHVEHLKFFVDEQRVGPYRIWHHEHHLRQVPNGVLMTDMVTYQPPMGFLGSIANTLFIKRQLNGIFEYRRKTLNRLFP